MNGINGGSERKGRELELDRERSQNGRGGSYPLYIAVGYGTFLVQHFPIGLSSQWQQYTFDDCLPS